MSEYIELSGTSPNGVGAGTAWAGEASLIIPEPWVQDAACAQTDPELFFPTVGGDPNGVQVARDVCGRCPVADECLTFALRTEQRHGVWGGLTTRQRGELVKRQRRVS